jgi:hypothetical protein
VRGPARRSALRLAAEPALQSGQHPAARLARSPAQ